MLENEEIIKAVKGARLAKGLSQQELGSQIGVPQSHISKIEKGVVDIQLSSLIQITRALDLEVTLVPKKAVPAVKSVVAGFPRDRTPPALSEIRKTQVALERIDTPHLSSEYRSSIEKINNSLKGLQALNYDTDAFVRLRKTLEQISKISNLFAQNDGIKEISKSQNQTAQSFKSLTRASDELHKLRNSLAHRHELTDLYDRPAYSLEAGDE